MQVDNEIAISAESLFRRHASFVARLLFRLGVRPDAIDDAVQEVFLVVHRQGGYRPGAARPTSYLANLSLHAASAHRRRERRRRDRESDAPVEDVAIVAGGPVEVLETNESLRRLEAGLARLEPGLRTTWILAEIEGETCASIAAAMGIPVGTVYWRLHEARKKFQKALQNVDASQQRRAFGVPPLFGFGLLRRDSWRAAFHGGLASVGAALAAAAAVVAVVFVMGRPASRPLQVLSRAQAAIPAVAPAATGEWLPPVPRVEVTRGPMAAVSDALPVELLPRAASSPASLSSTATASSASAPSTPSATSTDDLTELRDVAEAERTLTSDPRAALERIRADQARQPHGYLEEERDYVAIMALLELGRLDEARGPIHAFFRAHPDGAFGRRIREASRAAHATP